MSISEENKSLDSDTVVQEQFKDKTDKNEFDVYHPPMSNNVLNDVPKTSKRTSQPEGCNNETFKNNISLLHKIENSFLEDSDDEDYEKTLKIKKKTKNVVLDSSDDEGSEKDEKVKKKIKSVILDDSDNDEVENCTAASDKEDDELNIEDTDKNLLEQDKENIIDDDDSDMSSSPPSDCEEENDSDMSSSPPSDCEEENDVDDNNDSDIDDIVRIYRSGDASHHDGGSFAAEEAATKKQKQRSKKNKQSEILKNLRSETQRMIRESKLNMPYHTPEPIGLSDYLKSRKQVKEQIINCTSEEMDKDKKRKSKMICLLEKKLGKPVPKLSNNFCKTLTVGRKINQSVELVPKKLNPKILKFKQKILPPKDKKLELDEAKLNRQKLKEKLQASMRVNREQERFRKEEERKIDNEEIAEEYDYDEEEAELSDDESSKDDFNEKDDYQNITTENLHTEDIFSVVGSEINEVYSFDENKYTNSLIDSDEEVSSKNNNLNTAIECTNDINENFNDSRSQSLFKDKNLSDLDIELPPNPEISSSPKSIHNTSGCSFFNRSFGRPESPVLNLEISNCSEIETFDDRSPKNTQDNLIDLVLEAENDNANDGTEIGSSLLNFLSHNFTPTEVLKNKTNPEHEFNHDANSSPWVKSEDYTSPNADRDSSSDDDEAIIIRKKKQSQSVSTNPLVENKHFEETGRDKEELPIYENFLDEEAELSGDDAGEGDEFDEGKDNDYYEDDGIDEELPDVEEIKHQVNKVHQRQLLDEDRREIELLQEAFVEDNPFNNRKRRFRWKNINNSDFTQNIINDADNSDDNEILEEQLAEEESQWRSERLQREEFLANLSNKDDFCDEDSQLLNLGKIVVENSKSRFSINSRLSSKEMIQSASNSSCRFQPPVDSFLKRGNDYHSKIIKIADMKTTKSAVNSEKMVFKKAEKPDINQTEQIANKRHSLSSSGLVIKKPKKTYDIELNENSNSVFDLF